MTRAWAGWMIVLVMAGCPGAGATGKSTPARPDAGRSWDPTSDEFRPPPLPRGHVVIQDEAGTKHLVEVEIAATDWARGRGLMWRTDLPEGKGMLFVFPREEVHSFWMKNTLIPLDMVFIGQDLKVVGVVENAQPRTLVSRSVGRPSQYVLEVPGGWSRKIRLAVGAPVAIDGLSGIELR